MGSSDGRPRSRSPTRVTRRRAGLQILAALVRSPIIDEADAGLAFAIVRAVTQEEEEELPS
jgi:hypothetical protein